MSWLAGNLKEPDKQLLKNGLPFLGRDAIPPFRSLCIASDHSRAISAFGEESQDSLVVYLTAIVCSKLLEVSQLWQVKGKYTAHLREPRKDYSTVAGNQLPTIGNSCFPPP